jgi:hypothetical protein
VPLNCWVSVEGLRPELFHSTTSIFTGLYNPGVSEIVMRK